jgi:hypothetical protein
MVTYRRKIAAIFFGLFYGGSFINGIDIGLSYVTTSEDCSICQLPWVEFGTHFISVFLMGLFSSYSSRSAVYGVISSGIGAVAIFFLPRQQGFLEPGYLSLIYFALSIPGCFYGKSLPISTDDLNSGRLFGVSWKHWLWLWLPWQYMIANAVWLGTPRVLLLGGEVTILRLLSDIAKSVICVGVLGYASINALISIKDDSQLSRLWSAGVFLFWFLVLPVVANLWRLFL